jgi:hypothetical protein
MRQDNGLSGSQEGVKRNAFLEWSRRVKNPELPHGASSKEKALVAIHFRSSERGILAFSRKSPFDFYEN